MPSTDRLFQPFACARLQLKNRLVMAPMTRSFSPGGIPGPEVAEYYARRAAHGIGLIITEGTLIDEPAAGNDARVPMFHGPALDGWRAVVEAVHAAGGKIAPQLWHVGMARKPGQGHYPDATSLGPSGLVKPGKSKGQPMQQPDIDACIAAYAQAAAAARELGFDAVELHGAHGYLIDQFFWGGTNQREDRYGGDLVARTRFAVEILQAVRAAVGADFPIILRFSQWKQQDYAARLAETPEELARFLQPLSDAGVNIFHCSSRRFWEAEFPGSDLNLAGWTRQLTGKPCITVGSVGLDDEFIHSLQGASAGVAGIGELLKRLEAEEFDLVAVGRALIANPDWAEKIRQDEAGQLLPYQPALLQTLK